jgi:hypothetical protein
MLTRRPNGRITNRPRRQRNPQLAEIHDDLKRLYKVTQDRGMPSIPDVQIMPAPKQQTIHTFRRTINRGQVTADAAGVTASLEFSLADDPSPTDFTSLFDQYRIAQVIVRFIPVSSSFGPSTTAAAYPSLLTCIDYDDNVAPASPQTVRQYETCQVTPNQSYVERVLNPKFATVAYQGAFTAYSQANPRQWIDCSFPNVEYYGVKWATTPITVVSGTYVLYNIECEYIFQFRNTQ